MSGNAAIVRQGYEAFNRRDLTMVAALLGDNVSWHERASLADSANARPITLELRPWPRINGSIRALDESPGRSQSVHSSVEAG